MTSGLLQMPAPRPRASAMRRSLPASMATIAPLLALAGGLALWVLSLSGIEQVAESYQPTWLALGLPLQWYLAAAIIGGAAVTVSALDGTRPWLAALLLAAIVLVLYGTVPAISHAPQYGWTYKHIGVTRSIVAHGSVSPHGDVYDRWPGLFALAAALSSVTGMDAMAFASWFEPLVTFLDALAICAIAVTITGNRRVGSLAALLWVFANWLGQDYFSPQGMGFFLALVVILVIVRQLPPFGVASGRLVSLAGKWSWTGKWIGTEEPPAERGSGWQAVALILALFAPIVATHQLTPYMLVAQVTVLTLLGLRPRWLFLAMAAMAAGYLVPNFSYMVKHYGLLTNLNPLSNVQLSTGAPTHPPWLASHAGKLLTAALLAMAAAAGTRLARDGAGRRVAVLVALAGSPFLFMFANSYGGEGILRVVLFASPWLAILAAWGMVKLAPLPRLGAALPACGVLGCLFVFAFAGFAAGNVLPPAEVQASEYYYSHAAPGSVLMVAGDDFPTNVSANYRSFAGEIGDSSPGLLQDPRLRGHRLRARDIPEAVLYIRQLSSDGYLVFSRTQYAYAAYYKTMPAGSLGSLERAVARSPSFRLWYRNADTRIYKLVSPSGAP